MTSTRESLVPSGGAGRPATTTSADGKSYIEVMVMSDIGIEIGPARRHDDFAQKTGIAKLVQRIVDSGQRNRHAGRLDLGMQAFRGDMAMAALEKHPRQRNTLPRRPQTGRAKTDRKVGAIV